MSQAEHITGIILAGGRSSRMGSEKGLLELHGKKMIEYIVAALKPITSEIILVSANPGYSFLGYPLYPDLITDCGPSGGIFTGLHHSSTEKNIVLSCDTPYINTAFLDYLIRNAGDEEITVPVFQTHTEALCGIYSKNIQPRLGEIISGGERKMTEILKQFRVNYLDTGAQTQFDPRLIFRNINTREDLLEANNIHTH
jgi:molybdopterin-guanine dinucleotide biosynthesis protein A